MNPKILHLSLLFLLAFNTSKLKPVIKFSGKTSTLKLDNALSQLILDSQLTTTGGTIMLRDNSTDAVIGQTITFSATDVTIGDCSTTITGTFDPSGVDAIFLNGSCNLTLKEGPLLKQIFVSGTGNSIFGSPSSLSWPIIMQDNATALNLWLKTPINQSIYLNNGTVTLNNNLNFTANSMLKGHGTIYGNNNSIFGVSGTIDSQLTFVNGVLLDLEPRMQTTIQGVNLIFNGSGQTSTINGNGNILTLANGGSINIGPNHTLVLNNVYLKGLDSFSLNRIVMDTSSTLKLSETSLGLQQPYTQTHGLIMVTGTDCKVVSPGHDFTITDSARLIIDGTTMWFDCLDQPNTNPIKFTNAFTQLFLYNGGSIKTTVGQNGVNGIDASNIETDKYIDQVFAQLTNNLDLKPTSRLFITNTTGFTKNVLLDGQGLRIKFPQGSQKLFSIDPNTNVTVTNLIFTDFNVETIDIGVNSNLFLGDKTLVELAYPWDITRTFKISGQVTIDGHASAINLVHDDAILVQPLAALTLKNTVIHGAPLGTSGGRLRVASNLHYPTSIILDGSELFLDSNYNFSVGTLEVKRESRIFGDSKTFVFSTNGSLIVHSGSCLTVDRTITFSYCPQPLPTTNPNPYSASKERFVFNDLTSYLKLRGCTLHSTATSIRLTPSSNLLLEDSVKFVGSATENGEEFEISTNANINLLAAANLELVGKFKYQ